jgi:hypothetical protein
MARFRAAIGDGVDAVEHIAQPPWRSPALQPSRRTQIDHNSISSFAATGTHHQHQQGPSFRSCGDTHMAPLQRVCCAGRRPTGRIDLRAHFPAFAQRAFCASAIFAPVAALFFRVRARPRAHWSPGG